MAKDWESRLENRSLPYYSTIVLVVRKGNPKGIRDWPDLLKPGVQIIGSNPKTSGGARLNLLAAWGATLKRNGITENSTAEQRSRAEEEAKAFVTQMYRQCPVLDSGARGATITFARRMIGDVHLTWENEAHLELDELPDDLEVIYPSSSIKAEPHVAIVDQNVDSKGTREVAEAYLKFLYSDQAQEIIAKNYYRPFNPKIAAQHRDRLPDIDLFRIDYIDKGGWDAAQKRFFADGGLFDQIYQPNGN
jgi:sulfate transport system substrate-binding protein